MASLREAHLRRSFLPGRAFVLTLVILAWTAVPTLAQQMTCRSVAESAQAHLLVAEYTPATPALECPGKPIPLAQAWLEKRSLADPTFGRKEIPGLTLVLRFEVTREQARLLYTLPIVGSQGTTVQGAEAGVVLVSEFVPEVASSYLLRFRGSLAANAPVVCALELHKN